MPCDIILLILSFICYSFFGLERVNPFQPQKIVAYEEQKSMMPNGITGLERAKAPMHLSLN
jgi:hypothetical protein